MFNAVDVAKWFMENNEDTPKNSFEGNMKLQKLLFFSQLIHIARTDNYLIKEEFKAYDREMIIENIYDREALETLRLTNEIYGDATAAELSALSNQFDFLKKYLETNQNLGSSSTYQGRKELQVIKDVLKANEMMSNKVIGEDLDY